MGRDLPGQPRERRQAAQRADAARESLVALGPAPGRLGGIKVKDGYFGAQFRRIARRRGEKRAAIAVAHSILAVVYHVLARATPYRDLGADHSDRLQPAQHARYHARRLAELGYHVTLEPIAAA